MNARPHLLTAALLAGAALLYCTDLDAIDLWAPDEPRYGQVAEEMRSMQHGAAGLFLLHLNGEAYTQKPPLYYWLAAAGGWLTGGRVTETLARLPSAVAGVGVVATCIVFGLALFQRVAVGRWAAALLLSTWFFSHLARRAQLDVLLTLFETLALLIFWRIEIGAAKRGRGEIALLHGLMGLAALTKGPVGWFPLLIIAVYLAWEGRLGSLRKLSPPWALLLSIGPTVGWVAIATALAPEGYFYEAVSANVFGRVVAASSHVHPFYYFLHQLPLTFLPFTLLAPLVFLEARARLRSDAATRRPWRFLLVWVAVPLLFFSLASGKRGLYMLPMFPALALLTAASLVSWLERHQQWPRRASIALFALSSALALVAAVFEPLAKKTPLRAIFQSSGLEIPGELAFALGGAIACGTGLAAVWSFSTRHASAPWVLIVATFFCVQLALFTSVYPRFDPTKSPRPIALAVAELCAEDEAIGIFDDPGLTGGINYYGNRRAEILPRPQQVAAFLENGGRHIVTERWKLPWLDPVGRFEVLTSRREGRRELAIVRRVATKRLPAD